MSEPLAAIPPAPTYTDRLPPADSYDSLPPLSQGERVIDAYVAPSKTFADIRRNRSWWLPFLLISLVGYAFSFTALHRVGASTLAENIMHSNPTQAAKLADAPPEQRAQTLKITAMTVQGFMYAAPLVTLLFTALLALLLWVGFNFVLGGSSTYGGMFAVSLYAWLPSIIVTLVLIVLLFVGDADSFNLNNPTGTNPGFYLGADAAAWLRTLLTSFDVFTLWSTALLGLGGAIVARVKVANGLILVFAFWFLIVLVKVGFAAATS